MEIMFAVTLGVMMTSGVYLLLRARIFPVVMGLTLISYAVNLFIFAMGRLSTGVPAIIGASAENYSGDVSWRHIRWDRSESPVSQGIDDSGLDAD